MMRIYGSWRSRVRASWYNYENNQQDELYRLIYYSNLAQHVSGNVYAQHQVHTTVFTVSGSVHQSCCRLVSWMSWNCEFIIPSQLYMFRAMLSPIIRSAWLYLQYLVVFTQVAAGWCLGWVETGNLLFQVSCTCFGRCFRPSSGALDCIYSIW